MRFLNRSTFPLGSALASLVVLTFTHSAHADECMTDTDCGHGFSCGSSIGSSAGGESSGTGGAGGSADIPMYCGDGICQTLSEDPDSCPEDCVVYHECTPNGCKTDADCADTYKCGDFVSNPGGSSGLCIAQTVYCATDTDCPASDYCFILGSSGSSSGAGGFGGTGSGTGGFGAGGTGGDAGMPGTSGTTASTPIPGVCVVRDDSGGTGGVSAGGSGGVPGGTGGIATGGTSTGGTGAGGTGTGGTSTGGTSAGGDGGTLGGIPCPGGGCGPTSTGGSSGTGTGGAPSGSGGTKSNGAGGTTSGGGTSGSAGSQSHDVVTHGGCAVSPRGERSPFGGLPLVGLALAWLQRRRRA